MRRSEPLPEWPERKHHLNRKKHTVRWCKGVVGREHITKQVPWPAAPRSGWIVDLCLRCGKQLNLRRPK